MFFNIRVFAEFDGAIRFPNLFHKNWFKKGLKFQNFVKLFLAGCIQNLRVPIGFLWHTTYTLTLSLPYPPVLVAQRQGVDMFPRSLGRFPVVVLFLFPVPCDTNLCKLSLELYFCDLDLFLVLCHTFAQMLHKFAQTLFAQMLFAQMLLPKCFLPICSYTCFTL